MTGQRVLASLLVAAALQHPAPALAQVDVQQGARVRLHANSGVSTAGILVASSKDSIFIDGSSDGSYPAVQKFALRDVTAIDLSIAQHGHTAAGILIGGVAGVGIGYLSSSLRKEDHSDANGLEQFGYAVGDAVFSGVAMWLCGIGGAFIGGVIGHSQKTDTWQPVDMSVTTPQLSVRRMPNGRTGVGLSFAFGGGGHR